MGCKIFISASSLFLGAGTLLLLPAGWWFGALFAAASHELCHYGALKMLGIRVISVRIYPFGAEMETTAMEPLQEVLSAMAGPLGSLVLARYTTGLPELALCACFQGCFNLFPVYPLDGGRIFRCLLPETVFRILEYGVLILVLALGFSLSISSRFGIYPLIPGIAAAIARIRTKFPCKEPRIAVQ